MQRHTCDEKSLPGRREFFKSAGATAAGLYLAGMAQTKAQGAAAAKTETLALQGGPKAVKLSTGKFCRWPLYGDVEEKEVAALLKSPNYGPISSFEKAWMKHFDAEFCKAHCNGTNALTSMWFALNLPAGSEVLVPDFSTWFPVVPMRLFDLVPSFVDVNPKTLNIDLEDCTRRMTPKTRAILAVHWYGLPCDMDQICDFAKEHGLDVLEDCSHAHGATVKGKFVGKWGRMAGFSLQGSKPLPALEGGMGMYQNRADYERAVTYGNYDLPATFPADSPYRKYQGTGLGSKLRMHPVAAILARNQLEQLDKHNAVTVAQIKALNDRITQLPGLSCPYLRPDMTRTHYGSNILFLDPVKAGMSRKACAKALAAEGVSVATSFGSIPRPWDLLHDYPMFREKDWWRHMPVLPDKVPGCDQANETIMYLPVFTAEAPELIDQYAKAFEKVWAHRKDLA